MTPTYGKCNDDIFTNILFANKMSLHLLFSPFSIFYIYIFLL